MEAELLTTSRSGGEEASAELGALLEAGGKRLRPGLVFLWSRMGEHAYERAAPAARAVELLHAATLVHDDVIDRADTRRGRPTVAARVGQESAILVGDHAFARAYLEAARTGRPEVVEVLANAVLRVCNGELEQQASRYVWSTPEAVYFERIERKTADLVAAACVAGAMCGGLDAGEQSRAREFGRLLGIAFQLADDVLDYTATAEELGKPAGHDLVEGMATLPLLRTPEALALLSDGAPPPPQVAARIVELVRGRGTAEALAEARGYAARAAEVADGTGRGDPARALAGLATYVVSRGL